jgi:ABC-type polysaccharide/polyol phosphate export permease
MSGPQKTHKMRITPGRVEIIDDSGTDRMARFWDMTQRTAMIAVWNMRQRAFDKSTGPLFLIVDPIMQALLYFYIVYIVFGVRGSDVSYVAIFTLVTLWRGHSMVMGNAPYYLSGQSSVLQQTRYPPQSLVAEGIFTDIALFLMLVVVVLVVLLIGREGPFITWLAFPLVLAVHLLFTAACAVAVAYIGVFVRETGIIVNFVVALWMYASPVVYGMERIGEPFRTIYLLTNPFAYIMPAYRSVLLLGEWPSLRPLIVITAVSVAMLAVGLTAIENLRGRIYRYL